MKLGVWHIAAVGLAGATMMGVAGVMLGVSAIQAVRKRIGDQAANVAHAMGHQEPPPPPPQ